METQIEKIRKIMKKKHTNKCIVCGNYHKSSAIDELCGLCGADLDTFISSLTNEEESEVLEISDKYFSMEDIY